MNSILGFALKTIGLSVVSIGVSSLIYKKWRILKEIFRIKNRKAELIKKRIKTILISPIVEELIFRYQIYQAVSLLDIDMEKRQTIFLIFSSLFLKKLFF